LYYKFEISTMPILFVYFAQHLSLKAKSLEPKEPQYKIALVLKIFLTNKIKKNDKNRTK